MNKYHAIPTTVDGIRFHSKKEARWYGIFRNWEKHGKTKILAMQKPFKFKINGILVCEYRADFVIMDTVGPRAGFEQVVDVKGKKTDVYKLKKKLMKACYGIEIVEL